MRGPQSDGGEVSWISHRVTDGCPSARQAARLTGSRRRPGACRSRWRRRRRLAACLPCRACWRSQRRARQRRALPRRRSPASLMSTASLGDVATWARACRTAHGFAFIRRASSRLLSLAMTTGRCVSSGRAFTQPRLSGCMLATAADNPSFRLRSTRARSVDGPSGRVAQVEPHQLRRTSIEQPSAPPITLSSVRGTTVNRTQCVACLPGTSRGNHARTNLTPAIHFESSGHRHVRETASQTFDAVDRV